MKGAQSATFSHGRRSKYIPNRLLDRYKEAQSDPQLLSLRDEIALTDARISGLLANLHMEADETLWQKLDKAWAESNNPKAGESGEDTRQKIQKLIETGIQEANTWKEIYTVVDQRRKLVEGEIKRLQVMGQMIKAERDR